LTPFGVKIGRRRLSWNVSKLGTNELSEDLAPIGVKIGAPPICGQPEDGKPCPSLPTLIADQNGGEIPQKTLGQTPGHPACHAPMPFQQDFSVGSFRDFSSKKAEEFAPENAGLDRPVSSHSF